MGDVEGALGRALVMTAALDVARGARDVERAVCGIRHELRTALRALGVDPDQALVDHRSSFVADTPPVIEDDTRTPLPFDRPG